MESKSISAQSLHTGVGLIDSQHQTFFTLLKRIKDKDFKQSPQELSHIIDELHLYTLYHFETEEKLLEENGLTTIDQHKKMHKLLTDKIEEFRLQNMIDSCVLAKEMSKFLEDWLIDHILNVDIKDLKIVTTES